MASSVKNLHPDDLMLSDSEDDLLEAIPLFDEDHKLSPVANYNNIHPDDIILISLPSSSTIDKDIFYEENISNHDQFFIDKNQIEISDEIFNDFYPSESNNFFRDDFSGIDRIIEISSYEIVYQMDSLYTLKELKKAQSTLSEIFYDLLDEHQGSSFQSQSQKIIRNKASLLSIIKYNSSLKIKDIVDLFDIKAFCNEIECIKHVKYKNNEIYSLEKCNISLMDIYNIFHFEDVNDIDIAKMLIEETWYSEWKHTNFTPSSTNQYYLNFLKLKTSKKFYPAKEIYSNIEQKSLMIDSAPYRKYERDDNHHGHNMVFRLNNAHLLWVDRFYQARENKNNIIESKVYNE